MMESPVLKSHRAFRQPPGQRQSNQTAHWPAGWSLFTRLHYSKRERSELSLSRCPGQTARTEAPLPGTLIQDQPVVSQPLWGPILWSFSPPGRAQGRNPALPTLGCALITSLKGKPFVWKEMVQKEAVPALKIGLETVSRAEIPVAEERKAFSGLWRSDSACTGSTLPQKASKNVSLTPLLETCAKLSGTFMAFNLQTCAVGSGGRSRCQKVSLGLTLSLLPVST